MQEHVKAKKTLLITLVTLVAILLGFVSARWMAQGNPFITLPWGVFAFLSAYVASTKREALLFGAIIGFVASYSYLWFDNTDSLTASKVITLIVVIALPALFGLLCGLGCSWVGWLLKARISKTSK